MKKLLSVFFFCCFFVLLLFLLLGGYEKHLEVLLQNRQHMNTYWLVSFLVLASDIFVPVPSSLVMILNGKTLGFLPGTVLSTVSGLCSSLLGFFLGRKSNSFINRFFDREQQRSGSKMFQKYGHAAIILSKALPIISEAVSFLSGTTAISFKKFLLYSFLGHLIISAVYAYVGSTTSNIDSNLISGAIIFSVLFLSWAVDRIMNRKRVESNQKKSF